MPRRYAAALILVAFTAGACGREAATTTEPALLPPYEQDDLAALFDPVLAPLGYQVTRASLIDRSTNQVDPEGDHLAIYLAPLNDTSPDQFAADFPSLVGVFLPFVFNRWPLLRSFDFSQEPFGLANDAPPSLTTIDLTRDAAAGVDWEGLDLAGIIALNKRSGISVWARTAVRESAIWRQAADL